MPLPEIKWRQLRNADGSPMRADYDEKELWEKHHTLLGASVDPTAAIAYTRAVLEDFAEGMS